MTSQPAGPATPNSTAAAPVGDSLPDSLPACPAGPLPDSLPDYQPRSLPDSPPYSPVGSAARPPQTVVAVGGDPFAPQGVTFQPISPRLATARLIPAVGFDLLAAIGFVVAGVLLSPWAYIGAAVCALALLWELWLIPRQVRAMGYALAEDHLLWRKGIMFRSLCVIPYGRMQFVDTSQGPLGRYLGIAEVKLHTASASTDATINGLPVAEAEHLRQLLSERGEQRMAGL